MLKVIITVSHVDTRAQSVHLRASLTGLSKTIATKEFGYDIEKLNRHVVILEEGLAARGTTSMDTIVNLHDAYILCKDQVFVRHATDEYAKWELGGTMTLNEYMESCLNKFKTLKMKGLWEAPSQAQEEIIALTAAWSTFKGRATNNGKRKEQRQPATPPVRERRENRDFRWKTVAPTAGEPKVKEFKGKTYHWCTLHEHPLWARHNPEAFPNLCKRHPNYIELEAAYNARGATEPTAGDIALQEALAAIEDSEQEDE